MNAQNTKANKFYLGLCMAGAVSAGSYTAGVIDFLLEALEEWEKRRGQEGVPSHRVEIPVVGGASAGGMTSLIAAASLQQNGKHLDAPDPADLLKDHPENILYHSWVDLTGRDMFTQMLDTGDIKPGEVTSALNSDFINEIAKRVFFPSAPLGGWRQLPAFFPRRLRLFTTLTNLQGFLYDVGFKADTPTKHNPYYINVHNDFACFELSQDELRPPNGGWIPLNIETGLNTAVAKEAAMATGAFPVGLKSRKLTRELEYVINNPLFDTSTLDAINKELPKGKPDTPYHTLNVDGGLINNEPFDNVRNVLSEISGIKDSKIYEDENKFNSTVVMIAPFPSSKPTPISMSQKLLHVIGLTLSSMISQMRSKPAHLVNAMNPDCAGQYLIAPSRRVPLANGTEESIQGEKAIACGALDGFSGFLNKEFRVHDFYLGRYNCKIFLRDYFTVSASAIEKNPIFSDGYAGVDKSKFKSKVDGSYQIIPVFFDKDPEFPAFKFNSGNNWPVIQEADILKFKGALKIRIEAILLNIKKLNPLSEFLLLLGSRIILRGMLAKAAIEVIESELTLWGLLKKKAKK